MNRVLSRLGLTAAAIVAGAGTIAHAQTATTGAIAGVVTKSDGSPVAGAQVTVSSAQIQRTVVTGQDGSYRLGLLNPGDWKVKVVKDGLQTASSSVIVYSQQTQTANFKMVGTAAAVVEVVAAQAAVDYTTTSTGQNLSMDQLAAIPKGRDFTSMAMLTPGVVDNGGFQANSPSMGGASAAENTYVLDGLDTTDFRKGYQGASLKTDFIDQVSVQTGGFSPEFGALGGVFNAITKSGSNDIKGSSWLTWDAIGIQAVAKKTKYAAQAAPNSRYDIGAEVGGPIIKDKLFYFVGVDADILQAPSATPNNNNLVGSSAKTTSYQFLSKINWFMTQDMQLTYFLNYNSSKFNQDQAYPLNGTASIGEQDKSTVLNTTLNFDWNITPALVFSAKAGYTDNKQTVDPTTPGQSLVRDYNYFYDGIGSQPGNNPLGLSPNTPFFTGGYGIWDGLDENKTTQYKVDLSWFIGDHATKFGVAQIDSKYSLKQNTSGGYYISLGLDNPNYGQNWRTIETTDAQVENVLTSYYAQDNWQIFNGFHLIYGFRFEGQDQKDFMGRTFMKFNNFSDLAQPRIGFTWDPENDGMTKVSGSWATYFERIPQRMAIRVFANEVYLEQDYSNATTTNTTYNPATGAYTFTGAPDGTVDYATPFSFDPIAENIKLPKRKEYTLGVDHTFKSGWTIGLHGMHRQLTNIIEDSVILRPFTYSAATIGTTPASGYRAPYDPGAPVVPGSTFTSWGVPWLYDNFAGQAILWNPGGSVAWTSRSISGIPNQRFAVSNTGFEPAGNTYDSVTLTADKKTDRDYFSASYTWSRLQGSYEGLVSSSNGQDDGNITASFDYQPYWGYGLLPLDRTNVVKVQYSHRFSVAGNDFNMGFNYTYQSGTPLSIWEDGRLTAAALGQTLVKGTGANGFNGNWGRGNLEFDPGYYGNATPFMGQLGNNGRTPSLNNVDGHLDYNFKVGSRFRIQPAVDVFNLFNTRYATTMDDHYVGRTGALNPSYMQATNWQVGRRYRFGIKVQF